MKRVLVLVKNNFINDRRVYNIAMTLKTQDYDPRIIAVSSYKKMKYNDNGLLKIIRIPSFSSLYSKPRLKIKAIESNSNKLSKSAQMLKQNKYRITFVSIMNSIFYNIGSFFYAIYFKPNYVWANDLNTLSVASQISKTCRSKLIYDSHEIFTEGLTFRSLSKIQRYFLINSEKKIIKNADAVVVTTNLRAKFLQNKYSLDKVWVIKNCHKLIENITSENLFRKEFPISESSKIFLYQGLIHKKRGIFNIVDAISRIENAVLVLMGDGKNKQELFNYVVDRNLENKVFIKDSVPMDSLIKYTASADVGFQLLLNSGFNHFSTISNKVFEYIMAEIPVIASDFPELRKLIIGNNIGIVVNPENFSEIINAIHEIVNNFDRVLEFKKNIKKVRTRYTWENEEKKIIKILNGIS
jgi:glycosyltransferase involved in cell wall biosynthesis